MSMCEAPGGAAPALIDWPQFQQADEFPSRNYDGHF
jgi:hypothetical protein